MLIERGKVGFMKVLDLFCGAGGAAMGYHQAGYEVVGVDHVRQPNYPFDFIQADALEYGAEHGHEYDLIHASPVCKAHSTITRTAGTQDQHPRQIAETRDVLMVTGRPYVIENVPGARRELINPVMLCGTMFDLLLRHRYFETSPALLWHPPLCNHKRKVVKHGRRPDRKLHYAAVTGHFSDVEFAQKAMSIDWMGQKELSQAIPPAYTRWIGEQMKTLLRAT